MGGLKGQARLPQQLDPRLRRNAAGLATDFEGVGGALTVQNGVIVLSLANPDPGLAQSAGLTVLLNPTNPGLSLVSGLAVFLNPTTPCLTLAGGLAVQVKAAGSGLLVNGPGLYVDNTVYVPYVGATTDVVLGSHFLSANQIRTPEIKTDATTPTDLTITTGAAKTTVLATPVYQDLQAGVDPARTTGTTQTVMVGNIRELVFSNGDTADFPSVELLHGYKEGTNFEFHLHFATRGTNASAYHVRYTLEYSLAPVNGVFGATTTLDLETNIPGGTTELTHFLVDLGVVSGAGLTIGTQVKYLLKKIASATLDASAANNPYILSVGVHYQVDTIGSRFQTTK